MQQQLEVEKLRKVETLFMNKHEMHVVMWWYYLFRLANAVKRECHHMGTIENVSVATATGDRCDLAPVETDGHLVGDFQL